MIIAVIGKTSSGKDTLAKILHEKYEYPFMVSYTTRPKRDYETNGKEHYFVTEDEAKELTCGYTNCLALTEIDNNHYFTLPSQVMDNDYIYIIDPSGVDYINKYYPDIQLFSVYVDCPEMIIKNRAILRGDDTEKVISRLNDERQQMDNFRDGKLWNYIIDNSKSKTDFEAQIPGLIDMLEKFKSQTEENNIEGVSYGR